MNDQRNDKAVEAARGEARPGPRRSTPDRRRPNLRVLISVAVIASAIVGGGILISSRPTSQPNSGHRSPSQRSSSPPPVPAVTGASAKSVADFEAVYAQLESTRTRAYDEYRPELLDDVYSSECNNTCNVADQKRVIGEMSKRRARFQGFSPERLLVQVVSDRMGIILEGRPVRAVAIRVVDEQEDYTITNGDGRVIEHGRGWSPRSTVHALYFSPTRQQWLIWYSTPEGSGERFLAPEPSPTMTP